MDRHEILTRLAQLMAEEDAEKARYAGDEEMQMYIRVRQLGISLAATTLGILDEELTEEKKKYMPA